MPDVLPVEITNNSGRGEQVHIYVVGTNLETGRLGYVNESGAFTPWPAGSIPPTPAPDVSIGGPANGASKTIRIPRGMSGRVYFSFGEKISFFLTPDGLVQPAPWNPSDPNHNVILDWSEFTLNNDGLWLNSSQV
ncbi:MAG TPA: beta-1,3-glucanase family protein, partial [Spirillospora sp.]